MFNSPMMLDFNSNSKRSKITKACDNCRRRRVKCDGVSDGCGGCKAAKTQCVYTTSNTKRGPPKGYVEVIEDRLGKIENMLAGIVKKKVLVPPSGKVSASLSEGEDNNDDDDDEDDDDHASVYSTDLVEVKKQPPASPVLQSASVRSNTPTAAVTRSGRSGSVTVSSLGRHSPLVSRNRSLTALLPFSQDSALQHQLAAQQDYPGPISHTDMAALTNMFDKLGTTSVRTTVPFPWLTPEQSRHYGRNYLQFSAQSLEPPLPPLSQTAAQTASLPDVTLELLNSFFDHFNIFLPIIHRPTFMKQWQRESCQLCPHASSLPLSNKSRSKQPQMQQQDHDAHKEHLQHPAAPLSPLLLNALLAVAFKMPSDAQQGHEARQRAAALSQSFFDAARLLLDDFSDVPRVSTVQALCLMSQFHHQGQWKATRNSGYLSMAIRMAHELGLNRDPEAVVGPEADALRYLWWSMFILDHQFSAWLGLSLLMHGKESNVELPMDVSSTQQDLRGFVCMVRLVKILGSVLQHSYSTQSLPPQFGGHDSMVSYIEGSLTSWLSNLAPDMRWHNPNMPGAKRGSPASPMRSPLQQSTIAVTLAPECSELYPAYLYIVYNTTLILLHRPYIVGAAGSPAAAQSNTICTGSGRAITDIAQGLDMEHCSYVVNRFTLYALLQAGVIHAMNAVYDKRGSEVAMEYYKRTLCVLEGFLACAAYSGGVAEGIKILEQFLATTSMAAAEEVGEASEGHNSVESYRMELDETRTTMRKKRQLDAYAQQSNSHSASILHEAIQSMSTSAPYQQQASVMAPSVLMTPATLSMMTSDLSNGHASTPYAYDINQHSLQHHHHQQQQHQQHQHHQSGDLKEQQKQQQLKIQQQHRMYQQLQTFGTGAIKVESMVENDMQKLEQQQQQQQQQLMRQQQQHRQQQQQQQKAAMMTTTTTTTTAAPVIPSHRYAMQMLQQQQQFQQQQHPHAHLQGGVHHGHGNMTIPMTMTMNALSMEAQSKMNQDFHVNNNTTVASSAGYDPTQFWVDFSATDPTTSSSSLGSGTINPAGLEHDSASRLSEKQNQFGATPLWM